jgi:hypothetical protein
MKIEEKILIEFLTENKVEVKLVKRRNKFYILVSEDKKKIKNKSVFETLDQQKSMDRFHKICSYFTKDLK